MTKQSLKWIERALLATGTVLALWCAMVLVRAEYYKNMPVPPPAAAPTLPGETPRDNPPTHRQVATGTWVARIEAPSVELAATVLEGTDDATLGRAAGHIEDTAYPGERGNVGIAGHRDTTFRAVRKLKLGDPLIVTTADRVYHYRIVGTRIVQPEDVWVLDDLDHPSLTLVTCYPFEYIGHAPKRFIISADLVGQEPRAVKTGGTMANGSRPRRTH